MSGSHLGVSVASHKAGPKAMGSANLGVAVEAGSRAGTSSRTPVSERGGSSTPGTSPGAVCSMPPSCSSR